MNNKKVRELGDKVYNDLHCMFFDIVPEDKRSDIELVRETMITPIIEFLDEFMDDIKNDAKGDVDGE